MIYRSDSLRILLLIIGLLTITGCDKNSDLSDLRAFTENAFKDKKPSLQPLPTLQPVSAFVYTASGSKDPFDRSNIKDQTGNSDIGGGKNAPDLTRDKQSLEQYSLEELKLVGVINHNEINWAIISAPDQTVHRVTQGDFIGKNHGRITAINQSEVGVDELVRSPIGIWEKRPIEFVLSD